MTVNVTLTDCTTFGALTLNNVDMHVPGAWTVLNVEELWTNSDTYGDNRPIPATPGRRALEWAEDQSTYTLLMVFSGMNDFSGAPHADYYAGLWRNFRYVKEQVVDPGQSDPDHTVPALFVAPDASQWTADVQPKLLRPGRTETPLLNGALTLVIPGVWFEYLGS